MAPRTRRSHIGGPNSHTGTVANENNDPFLSPTHMVTSNQVNGPSSNYNNAQAINPLTGMSTTL
jgi:hypothetical protein